MLELNNKIYANNNDILTGIVSKLEEIVNDNNNTQDLIIKRLKDIIIIMNKAINENNNNYKQIIELMNNMNKKLDNISNKNSNNLFINNGINKIKFYEEGKYIGQLVNNKKEGKGKMEYLNNDIYLGKIYEGEWKNDLREGRGIEIWKDGERFEGYFRNDKREGKGIYYFNDGMRYEGDYKNGKRDGQGVIYYKNGDREIGDFYNDYQIGKGALMTAQGEVRETFYKLD